MGVELNNKCMIIEVHVLTRSTDLPQESSVFALNQIKNRIITISAQIATI